MTLGFIFHLSFRRFAFLMIDSAAHYLLLCDSPGDVPGKMSYHYEIHVDQTRNQRFCLLCMYVCIPNQGKGKDLQSGVHSHNGHLMVIPGVWNQYPKSCLPTIVKISFDRERHSNESILMMAL